MNYNFVQKLKDKDIQELAEKLHKYFVEKNNRKRVKLIDYSNYKIKAEQRTKGVIEVFIDCPQCFVNYYQLHLRDFSAIIIIPTHGTGMKDVIKSENLTKDYTDYMGKKFVGYKKTLKAYQTQLNEQVK